MPVPSLPQELLELIIDAVNASGGTTPLKTLSEVSRAWRPRSQNNIFKKLRLDCITMRRIHEETDGAAESTGNTASTWQHPVVFSYVRKLRIAARQLTSPENDGGYLEILRFFTNVTSLQILDWDFREFKAHHIAHFLGHFGATTRALKLQECYVDSGVLIFLTSSFPFVDDLEVDPRYPCSAAAYRVQRSDRPSGRVGFRGNLTLRFLSAQHEDFLAFVNENSSDVRSISAELCVNKGELQRLFECRGGNLLSVGIHSLWKQGTLSSPISRPAAAILTRSSPDLVSLSSCTQLRTLSIHLLGDFRHDDPNWDALLTITSPHLEEIKICSFDGVVTNRSLAGWEGIDDLLCRHFDRSYQNGIGGFRVSMYPTDIDSEGGCAELLECVWKAWPRFVKKGTVVLSIEPEDGESNYRGFGPRIGR